MKKEDFTERATGRITPIIEDGMQLFAFIPDPIPRSMDFPATIVKLTEQAGHSLGRLFGANEVLNPWLGLFLTREAIASNAIEGTITTARELYLFAKEDVDATSKGSDRREVQNYINAMNRGIELIQSRPLSLNVINDLHAVLLEGARGNNLFLGKIRKRQNAISKSGFEDARFIPPPPSEILPAITDLEVFIHEETNIPNIIRSAMIHYQFEAIHPYHDGNGRLGRLLVPLLLSSWGVLPKGLPRFYLSNYLEAHDSEYRDRLLMVSRNGEWNNWIEFFLKGVISEADRTWQKSQDLGALREEYLKRIVAGPGKLLAVVNGIFQNPVIRVGDVSSLVKVSRQQAGNYIKKLVDVGILKAEGRQWREHYFADEIFKVFFEESADVLSKRESI